jgi:hypothetical protein
VLLASAAWTLFAFAGVYRWTTIPLGVGAVAIVFATRPRPILDRAIPIVDAALLAVIAAIAVQLIPLPANLRLALAPSAIAYEQAVYLTPASGASPASPGPITIDRDATTFALFLVIVVALVFWSARATFSRGGVRTTARGVAWLGLIVAPLACVQHAMAPQLFYGRWRPLTASALPYTPFVNRNDFAAWLILAMPLVAGYAVARLRSRRRPDGAFDPEAALDDTAIVLGVSIFAMTAGLLASLSRSGLAGGAVALLTFALLARRRMSVRRLGWTAAGVAATIVLAAMYANMSTLTARMAGAMSEGVAVRLSIWRQTWPMVRDFWPLGSGVGTYQRVMVLYQTSSRQFYISHADNEYLQVLAEGGALLAIPAAIAIGAAVISIGRRLRADRSALFWVRAGAASGIAGLAMQNMWEMTLRVPANAVLFAILAAVALAEPASRETSIGPKNR